LKARVHRAGDANLHFVNVGPGAMARPAEVNRSDRAKRARIQNLHVSCRRLCTVKLLHQNHVRAAGAVAGFAGDAGRSVSRIESTPDGSGSGSVASETFLCRRRILQGSEGVL
jgi:hypothetical protein